LSLESFVTVTSLEERMLPRPPIMDAPEKGVPVGRRMGVKSCKKKTNK